MYDPINVARQFAFIREAGENKGLRVESIQHWAGGNTGDSWCYDFLCVVFDICYQGNSPIPRFRNCQDLLELATKNHWLTDHPIPGDIVLSINPTTGKAHHVGIVTGLTPLTSIAGNTDETGSSPNGTGVFEHEISPANKVYVSIKQ